VLDFFGLTANNCAEIRLNIFTQIHEIVFHGKGGYDWNTVYNMPIWLRRFTFSKIQEYYEKESKQIEETSQGNKKVLMDSNGKINKENIPISPQNKKTSYK
jgi:hypothetical protein